MFESSLLNHIVFGVALLAIGLVAIKTTEFLLDFLGKNSTPKHEHKHS